MQTIIAIVLPLAITLGAAIWLCWRMWKLHRHHRRFMAVNDEVGRAICLMGEARTIEDLEARKQRVIELIEHLDQIRSQFPGNKQNNKQKVTP